MPPIAPHGRARGGATFAIAILAAMAVGLALRLAAARGGLWVDEAWSARYVAQAGDALGVVWRINHDNNHFLNSGWMLLVGPYAAPMLVRALAIVSGVAAVGVAALIGLRRDPATGIVAALLFAVAPILVAYGAEARGYAPMVLAMLFAIHRVARWIDGDAPPPSWTLAALTAFGMAAHFTFVFALAALGGWIVVTRARRDTVDAAVRTMLRTLGPSIGMVALVVVLVTAAARASVTGFQTGGYAAFSLASFSAAFSEAIVYTLAPSFGPPAVTIGIALVAILAALRFAPDLGNRRYLYVFACLLFPTAMALGRIGNTGFARYYLLFTVASLLLVADVAGAAIARGGWRRTLAIAFVVLIAAAALLRDHALATAARGDPARAIAAMQAAAPDGTTVLVDTIRPTAVLDAAARTARYGLRIRAECAPAAFVFVEQDTDTPPPVATFRCGQRYVRLATGRHLALSGIDWTLYGRASSRVSAPATR